MYSSKTSGLILDVANQVGGTMPSVTTLYDSSRMHNNSSVWTGVTWSQLPSGQWVMNFDGASQIVIPNNAIPNSSLSRGLTGFEIVTFLCWVKRTVINASNCHIFCMFDTLSDSRLRIISAATTGWMYFISRSNLEVRSDYLTTTIPEIKWDLWGACFNLPKQTITGYFNSSSFTQGGFAFSNSSYQNVNGLSYIGGDAGAQYFIGQLARLRVLTRAVSNAEIRDVFTREAPLFGVKA
jgi:hypothetical protein